MQMEVKITCFGFWDCMTQNSLSFLLLIIEPCSKNVEIYKFVSNFTLDKTVPPK